MEITEEQRKRAEGNRLAALAKRKALLESTTQQQQQQQQEPWKLFKCRKFSQELNPSIIHCDKKHQITSVEPVSTTHLSDKFQVRLEICSPDSFQATPTVLRGFPYPGEEDCLRRLRDCLSDVMPSHYTQDHGGGKACVYKLKNYRAVVKCLNASTGIEVEEIPWGTFNVVERLSHSFIAGQWIPCRPEHLLDDKVNELIGKLPGKLVDVLLPFQLDGLKFGLRRGGRCLIADEMGLGKTLQAIAIAGCFMNEGSILVVCPAILRFSWAEELERWLPFCLPADIHLVFGHKDNPAYLSRCPRVVVISYTMLHRLRKSMIELEWALLIVDESHHVRCTKKPESQEIHAVLDVASKIKRIVLLSGTPSLSRPYDIFHQINMLWPGLLGTSKFEFAKTYCDVKIFRGSQGKTFQDFSKGIRLEELNVLLKQTVMIRRLKEHVLVQLPPKRRQMIRLLLKHSDIIAAKAVLKDLKDNVLNSDSSEKSSDENTPSETMDEPDDGGAGKSGELSWQELGVAKLSGFCEWLSIHPLIAESDCGLDFNMKSNSLKMIIFGHHHKVLDGIQEFVCRKGIEFIRIDGRTPARDRQQAVMSFRSSPKVKIAIIGIQAAGFGLDFSSAQNVVFLELPQSPSLMLQAEDRAHRQGQTNAVNIYIFCAKDTVDESHWQSLNSSLHRVSSTTDGKYDAVQEIAVECVSYLETSGRADSNYENHSLAKTAPGELSAELLKLPPNTSALLLQPCEENSDQSAAKMVDTSGRLTSSIAGISMLADSPNSMTDKIVDIDMCSALEGNLEADVSEVETGILLHSRLDQSHEDMDEVIKDYQIFPQTEEVECDQPVPENEDDKCYSEQVDALRFEVSLYTERIHLYTCVPGADTRPRPLFENFRQEELESPSCISGDGKRKTMSFRDNPSYRHALLEFISQWNKLRPIEKKKLRGKPLQLPLAAELCYLSESINHDNWGLLRGKSNRRKTPFMEVSHPLPSDAVWRKIHLRSGNGKKDKEYTQGWTLTDEPLCKLCQKPCMSDTARIPEYFEDLFCNLACSEEYRLRTSNRFLRQELFEIEHGVCTSCQLDCHKLVEHIRPLSLATRREYIEKVAPKMAKRKNLLEKLVIDPSEGNAWHADHIVPVYRGGGECRLENIRTLCVACHYDVTKAQCAERRLTRVNARKQLKVRMSDLKKNQMIDGKDSRIKLQDHGQSEIERNVTEDELLVKVPGSAYSEVKAKILEAGTGDNLQ
ncbi:DNA annealing helicase and endonuclease ZRANB3 [Quillaja saponaria]|uniref:DNA annealing helicase and endonuclease ZRANB3 n=1 Tax=Quillaja saponaria TaxID=32244 RepID=A0AAD7QBI8_QUISA|nr:DNA annealing helicase and endonuclease ZRANB3 [Quillaja saponaria]